MDLAVHRTEPEVADLLVELGVPYGPREMVAFDRLPELQQAVDQRPAVMRERYRPLYGVHPGQEPTLLGIALSRGLREVSLFLLDRGHPLDTVEGVGKTLMHMAALGVDPDLIRLLAERGLDVNAQDDFGDTPLLDCLSNTASHASRDTISTLIEVDADVNARRIDGATCLHVAVSSERADVIPLLLAAGADPAIPDENGQTPDQLAQTRSPSIGELFTDSPASHRSPQ